MQLKNYSFSFKCMLFPLLAASISASTATAQIGATKVLGQPDLYSGYTDYSTVTAANFYYPEALTSDASGNLYVAEYRNRILIYKNAAAKANGADADFVIGQPDFVSAGGGTSPNNLYLPISLYIDRSGNLYVGDYLNNRVLIFKDIVSKVNNNTLVNGLNADYVLGQNNFYTNGNGTSTTAIWALGGITMDAGGDLFIVDYYNHRILMYPGVRAAVDAGTFVNGMAATKVLGRSDFTTGNFNPDPVSDHTLANPRDLLVDGSGNLYVADRTNNRVLRFNDVVNKPNGAAADMVLGQPDFNSNGSGTGPDQMNIPVGLAMTDDKNLLVSELINFRIDRFANPATITTGSASSSHFGQFDNATNPSPTSNGQLPSVTIVPGSGTWAVDQTNYRVILFDNLISLPLGLLTFTADKNDAGVLLHWTIAADNHPGNITLQRSTDGIQFEPVTTVTTGAATAYNYTDTKPLGGRSYYRLQVTGKDGAVTYSEARVINENNSAGNMPQTWPNPMGNVLHISTGAETPCNVWLCDMSGKIVVAAMSIKDNGIMDVAGLPNGTYLLHIGNGTCMKVVK